MQIEVTNLDPLRYNYLSNNKEVVFKDGVVCPHVIYHVETEQYYFDQKQPYLEDCLTSGSDGMTYPLVLFKQNDSGELEPFNFDGSTCMMVDNCPIANIQAVIEDDRYIIFRNYDGSMCQINKFDRHPISNLKTRYNEELQTDEYYYNNQVCSVEDGVLILPQNEGIEGGANYPVEYEEGMESQYEPGLENQGYEQYNEEGIEINDGGQNLYEEGMEYEVERKRMLRKQSNNKILLEKKLINSMPDVKIRVCGCETRMNFNNFENKYEDVEDSGISGCFAFLCLFLQDKTDFKDFHSIPNNSRAIKSIYQMFQDAVEEGETNNYKNSSILIALLTGFKYLVRSYDTICFLYGEDGNNTSTEGYNNWYTLTVQVAERSSIKEPFLSNIACSTIKSFITNSCKYIKSEDEKEDHHYIYDKFDFEKIKTLLKVPDQEIQAFMLKLISDNLHLKRIPTYDELLFPERCGVLYVAVFEKPLNDDSKYNWGRTYGVLDNRYLYLFKSKEGDPLMRIPIWNCDISDVHSIDEPIITIQKKPLPNTNATMESMPIILVKSSTQKQTLQWWDVRKYVKVIRNFKVHQKRKFKRKQKNIIYCWMKNL